MKNDSLSFKLLALVILAGVVAAFLDTSASPAPAKTAVAQINTATAPSE